MPVSDENQVLASVHRRSALSRSSTLACGYNCMPPTVLPVVSQYSDTQGLYDATRVASVPAPTFTPRSSMRRMGGVACAAREP